MDLQLPHGFLPALHRLWEPIFEPLLAEEHPVIHIECIQVLSFVFLQDYIDPFILRLAHHNLCLTSLTTTGN